MEEMTSIEWDIKAFELLHDLKDEDPTAEELQRYLFNKLGPRPKTGTRKLKELPGTIEIMKKLNTRKGWHRLPCRKELLPTLVALGHVEVRRRSSGWYEMKLTAKGRKFLHEYKE